MTARVHESDDQGPRSLLKLDDQRIKELLDTLEERDMNSARSQRRRDKRFPLRVRKCRVDVIQPGAVRPTQYLVHVRDISAQGLSFLHGGFMHINTRVAVHLMNSSGRWFELDGTVANCDYIEDGVHFVGVALANHINPADFCTAASAVQVLLIDDDDVASRLIIHLMSTMNVEVTYVRDGETALEEHAARVFDLVLCDVEMDGMSGDATVGALREKGFEGRIWGISASERPEDRERMVSAGCDGFVSKPLTSAMLREVLSGISVAPLSSQLSDDPAMREFLRDFGNQLQDVITQLDEAMRANQTDVLERTTRNLKGTAGQYGYPQIAELARELETGMYEGVAPAMLIEKFSRLRSLCQRASLACTAS